MINYQKKKATLEEWIREAITESFGAPESEKQECTAIALVHVVTTESGTAIREELYTHAIGPRVDSSSLAEMFNHKARVYAQDMPGVQTFMLLAFYNGSKEPSAKHPFRITGELDYDGMATEPATETGQRQQGMRLLEALTQGAFRERAHFIDSVLRSHEAAARHNAVLQENNFQAFEIIRDLMLQMSKQQHEMQIAIMNREMASKLLSFVPGLVNTVAGSQVFPQSTADTSLIEAIANNMDQEKLEKLITSGALPNNVMSVLAQRIIDIKKNQEQEKGKFKPQDNSIIKKEETPSNGLPTTHPDDIMGTN